MTDPQEPQEGWEYPDHTAAVIEAARAVLALFSVVIVSNRKTGKAWLEVTELASGSCRHIYEGDDRDDIYSRVAELSGAIEAYDEAEIESDILTTESEG